MKSSVEVIIIAAVAVVGGWGTWMATGRPAGDPGIELEQTPLKEGEVRLDTLLEEGLDGVLWVDARRPQEWQADGLKGSISVSMLADEDLGSQVARHADAFFGASRVVIYCDGLHCTLSHEVADQLKDRFRDFVPGEILVLQGGMTALRAAGMVGGAASGSSSGS